MLPVVLKIDPPVQKFGTFVHAAFGRFAYAIFIVSLCVPFDHVLANTFVYIYIYIYVYNVNVAC